MNLEIYVLQGNIYYILLHDGTHELGEIHLASLDGIFAIISLYYSIDIIFLWTDTKGAKILEVKVSPDFVVVVLESSQPARCDGFAVVGLLLSEGNYLV